jgi:hypothetical protein
VGLLGGGEGIVLLWFLYTLQISGCISKRMKTICEMLADGRVFSSIKLPLAHVWRNLAG